MVVLKDRYPRRRGGLFFTPKEEKWMKKAKSCFTSGREKFGWRYVWKTKPYGFRKCKWQICFKKTELS
jgi:hypothetical protein